MEKRFMSIWFRYLLADWQMLRRAELKAIPFVFSAPDCGRLVVVATSQLAEAQGIVPGTAVADAKAVTPGLEVIESQPGRNERLLKLIGEWLIRYTPFVVLDPPDGLILDITGCTHLWGGERGYYKEVVNRLKDKGYEVRAAIADTAACAWAVARFAAAKPITEPGRQAQAVFPLPPAALRLEAEQLETLHQLGMYTIGSFAGLPRQALRRRFGDSLSVKLGQALGTEKEVIKPLRPVITYQERLPCMEPIRTRVAIQIAIQKLLEMLCPRLHQDGKGLRTAILKCYRIDGAMVQVTIGTNRPSESAIHLFKLFELKIGDIRPEMGIELFVLEAPKVEAMQPGQEVLWSGKAGLENVAIAELLDRVANKVGITAIQRFLPAEHYWPERSVKKAAAITDKPNTCWYEDKPRPFRLLADPQKITALAAIPDYPPKVFIYQNERHELVKTDGPERIEQEWWLAEGEHRDYYIVEDKQGRRYWVFRSGHYTGDQTEEWFLHGFFA